MTAVSVHQPSFLPWLKLLAKIAVSDVYVAYDSVQFTPKEFHARQLIRNSSSCRTWLTVPTIHTSRRQTLCHVRIAESVDWRSRHLHLLEESYRSANHFSEVFNLIERVYAQRIPFLVEHNIALMTSICEYLDLNVRIVRATDLQHYGDRTQRLVSLVQAAQGSSHVTSSYGTDRFTLDWSQFRRVSIPVYSQEYTHPRYEQGSDSFVAGLAGIDLLFSEGKAAKATLLRSTRLAKVV